MIAANSAARIGVCTVVVMAEVVAVVGAVAAAMWVLDRWLNRRNRMVREQIDHPLEDDDRDDLVSR